MWRGLAGRARARDRVYCSAFCLGLSIVCFVGSLRNPRRCAGTAEEARRGPRRDELRLFFFFFDILWSRVSWNCNNSPPFEGGSSGTGVILEAPNKARAIVTIETRQRLWQGRHDGTSNTQTDHLWIFLAPSRLMNALDGSGGLGRRIDTR